MTGSGLQRAPEQVRMQAGRRAHIKNDPDHVKQRSTPFSGPEEMFLKLGPLPKGSMYIHSRYLGLKGVPI